MKNNKFTANQEYKGSDLLITDNLEPEVTNKASSKVDKVHQSNTEIEFVENFNPDDFE